MGGADQRADHETGLRQLEEVGTEGLARVSESVESATPVVSARKGVSSTMRDGPAGRPDWRDQPTCCKPAVSGPDAQAAPSSPVVASSESQATVTANPGAAESDDLKGSENSREQCGSALDRDPPSEPVEVGVEYDSAPTSQVAPGVATLSDGEKTTESASSPKLLWRRYTRRVAPEKRGGRPRVTRGLVADAVGATTARNAARAWSLRPELVCWREGMAWKVGVEVPDEMAELDLCVVDGAGNALQEDQRHELHWPLMEPLGAVTVRWSDGAAIKGERYFEASDHRIFKVVKSGSNGRYVARVTRGNYVVIAPQALSRDEAISGTPPVAPENVFPEQAKLLAHHLLVERVEDGLVLDGGGVSRVEVRASTATVYELIGNVIADAHPEAGPLFGGEPPRLQMEGGAEQTLFVLGVEGSSPQPRSRQLATNFDELRDWLEDKQSGWFYVRAYDGNEKLIESLDFRYVKGLEAIEVTELSPLPGLHGHCPAKVVFRVARGTVVSLVEGAPEIAALHPDCADGFVLPATPGAGRARWSLRAETGNMVDVVVHVPRIWWALTASGNADEAHAWSDRPNMLSEDDLRPTSPMLLSVLMPKRGWADWVTIGFRHGSPRRLRVSRSERELHYPLRNLGESDVLRGAVGTCDLLLSVGTPVTEHGPVVVATVELTEKPPEEERAERRDLLCLRAPCLMSKVTLVGRIGTAQERRVVKRLRNTWYRKARRGGRTETLEFVRQALALVAALLDREPARRLPSRLQRKARSLSDQAPTAVASWQRWMRTSEPHKGSVGHTGRDGGQMA